MRIYKIKLDDVMPSIIISDALRPSVTGLQFDWVRFKLYLYEYIFKHLFILLFRKSYGQF